MTAIRRMFRPEQVRELSLVLIIIAAVLFFGTQIDNYYSGRTFTRISTGAAIMAVVAVGQTLIVLTRNIDLSVGSIVGFTAYFVGTQLAAHNDMAPLVAVLMAVGVGAIMGVLNGLLVAYGKVPAIIVTLGTLAIYRSILVDYSGAKTVTTESLPKWLVDLSSANLFKSTKMKAGSSSSMRMRYFRNTASTKACLSIEDGIELLEQCAAHGG